MSTMSYFSKGFEIRKMKIVKLRSTNEKDETMAIVLSEEQKIKAEVRGSIETLLNNTY
jgi:hypothetical protein